MNSFSRAKHIVVLCDYGLDDAIATLHLFEHADRFEKIDIVAIAGNFPAETSLKNLCTLASMANLPKGKLRIVETLGIPQPTEELTFVHGDDGMGDMFPPLTDDTPVLPFNMWLDTLEECDILLSLGPLTVTQKILEKISPKEFVFMAGCIDGVPNYKGYEFNHGLNPAAFSSCTKYAHKAVTLDIACPALDISDREPHSDTPKALAMRRYRDFCAENGEVGCYVWDDIAVTYILQPEYFTVEDKTDQWGNIVHCLKYKEDV